MRRGVLIHGLFERLPDVAPDQRARAGAAWLKRMAADVAPDARAAMLGEVQAVLDHPDWRALFGPGSLAEAPFSAVVDGQVIAGSVDRLLVTGRDVLVVDYKTGLAIPETAAAAAPAHLRQMAAYVAALAVIFPASSVRAALLFTAGPRLLPLDPALLAAHKPGLAPAKANLSAPPLEVDRPSD